MDNENIFADAKFGDQYRTNDDEIPTAIYLGKGIGDHPYHCAIPVVDGIIHKRMSYVILQCDRLGTSKSDIDIESRIPNP